MNGIKLLLDTNIFIYLGNGDRILDEYLAGKQLYYSHLTQIELLGHKGLSKKDIAFFEEVLDACIGFELNEAARSCAIQLKRTYAVKTPDAIIAATAIVNNCTLLTYDKGFQKIKELSLILLNK